MARINKLLFQQSEPINIVVGTSGTGKTFEVCVPIALKNVRTSTGPVIFLSKDMFACDLIYANAVQSNKSVQYVTFESSLIDGSCAKSERFFAGLDMNGTEIDDETIEISNYAGEVFSLKDLNKASVVIVNLEGICDASIKGLVEECIYSELYSYLKKMDNFYDPDTMPVYLYIDDFYIERNLGVIEDILTLSKRINMKILIAVRNYSDLSYELSQYKSKMFAFDKASVYDEEFFKKFELNIAGVYEGDIKINGRTRADEDLSADIIAKYKKALEKCRAILNGSEAEANSVPAEALEPARETKPTVQNIEPDPAKTSAPESQKIDRFKQRGWNVSMDGKTERNKEKELALKHKVILEDIVEEPIVKEEPVIIEDEEEVVEDVLETLQQKTATVVDREIKIENILETGQQGTERVVEDVKNGNSKMIDATIHTVPFAVEKKEPELIEPEVVEEPKVIETVNSDLETPEEATAEMPMAAAPEEPATVQFETEIEKEAIIEHTTDEFEDTEPVDAPEEDIAESEYLGEDFFQNDHETVLEENGIRKEVMFLLEGDFALIDDDLGEEPDTKVSFSEPPQSIKYEIPKEVMEAPAMPSGIEKAYGNNAYKDFEPEDEDDAEISRYISSIIIQDEEDDLN